MLGRLCAGAWLAVVVTAGAVPSLAQTTYHKEISRLMQAKCEQCHQPGKIAPMSLLTYDDVSTYAPDIQRVLKERTMPPWKPVAGYGEFRHSYALGDGDRQMFLDWIANGLAEGDPSDEPDPLPLNPLPWDLGAPDLTLQIPQYTPPPGRPDTYRCFSLQTGLASSTYINASQALPGAAKEVHHVLLLLDPSGSTAALDGADGQPGYDCFGDLGLGSATLQSAIGALVGTWTPGAQTSRLDDGIGILIPGNARIVMQVHYHPAGRSVPDQTAAGFYFAPPNSVKHRLISLPLVNTRFQIPPGDPNYGVTAQFQVPFFLSGKAVLILPHMHLLGRKIAVEMTDANGNVTPMIRIDDWDFNWQGSYTYTQPLSIGPNSTVKLTSFYDNSDGNPRNPNNPIRTVKWGEGTTDEMCIALIGVILDDDRLLSLLF